MKKPDNEPRIAVQLMIRASLLGPLVVFLDNRADEFGSQIVKEVGAGKNLPRGAFLNALKATISSGVTDAKMVRSMLRDQGFTAGSIDQGIRRNVTNKIVVKKGDKILLTKKGKV